MKKIKVISCVATVAVMAAIFFFSSQTATVSSNTSSGIANKVIEFILAVFGNGNSDLNLDIVHKIVRKSAHFSLYFILALSAGNTAYQLFGVENKRLFLYTLPFCLFYAISDEIHQIFVPGRTAMAMDIGIDFAGAVCGCIIYVCIKRIYDRSK